MAKIFRHGTGIYTKLIFRESHFPYNSLRTEDIMLSRFN